MKGFYKFFGLVAGICFAFGIAFSITGAVAGVSPLQAIRDGALSLYIDEHGIHTGATEIIDTATGETKAIEIAYENYNKNDVQNLEVDLDAGNVNFYVHSDSEEIRIEYHDEHGGSVSSLQGDTLHIGHQGISNSVGLTDFGSDIYVDIYVPEGWIFENVKVEIDAGTVYMDQMLVENNFEVGVDAGGLECYYYQADNLMVNVDAGSANFYAGHCIQSADLDCTAGSIWLTLDEPYSSFDYEISSNIGMVQINGNTYGGLDVKHNISHSASKKIKANADAGSIEIYTQE